MEMSVTMLEIATVESLIMIKDCVTYNFSIKNSYIILVISSNLVDPKEDHAGILKNVISEVITMKKLSTV